MTTLLITSSLFGPGGQSTTLANELASSLGGNVIVRDVAKDPVPHLDGERFGAFIASLKLAPPRNAPSWNIPTSSSASSRRPTPS